MSSSSTIPCVAEKCELASLALCQCCKKDLCIDHLNEHANQRNEKLLPFIDKINILLNRFNNFYNDEQSGFKQLDQWKQDAYKIIEDFYVKKQQEFRDETVDKQREKLNDMNNKLKELIRKKGGTQEDFDTFSENMRLIEQNLDKFQQIQVILPPLVIDDNCILRPVAQENGLIEKTSNEQIKSTEHQDESSEKSSSKKKSSEKSSKKKKKSSRYSDDSSDRSSRHRSRSPRSHSDRSRRKRDRSVDSNSSSQKKQQCDDCHDCRFYQDRFGPGFMDSFGPCSCECHKWVYST